MDIAGIRDALHKQPFEPFVMRLADGRSLPVPHPDFVAVGRRRVVVISKDDTTATVEPLLIVSLDTVSRGSRGGNGAPKKRRPDA
jgi:hypothetical protein